MEGIDVRQILVGFMAITVALTVHEFAHALVADRLGDPTPRRAGRLTLNPMVHWRAEPIGSLVAPLIGAFSGFLLGWASTPVTPHKATRKITLRQANFLIAAAGPFSNVLLAVASAVILAPIYVQSINDHSLWYYPLARLLEMSMLANVILAVFNMLPIPPLDGFTVLASVAPRSWARGIEFLQQFGMILLLLIILRGEVIFNPIIGAAYDGFFALVRAFN